MKYFILLLVFSLISCDKKMNDVYSVAVEIYCHNQNNEDLFNPYNSSHFSFSDIAFKSSQFGENTILSEGTINTTLPLIGQNVDGRYFLKLGPSFDNYISLDNEPWVIVFWPDGSQDRITFIIEKCPGATIATDILLNGSSLRDSVGPDYKKIILTK